MRNGVYNVPRNPNSGPFNHSQANISAGSTPTPSTHSGSTDSVPVAQQKPQSLEDCPPETRELLAHAIIGFNSNYTALPSHRPLEQPSLSSSSLNTSYSLGPGAQLPYRPGDLGVEAMNATEGAQCAGDTMTDWMRPAMKEMEQSFNFNDPTLYDVGFGDGR